MGSGQTDRLTDGLASRGVMRPPRGGPHNNAQGRRP